METRNLASHHPRRLRVAVVREKKHPEGSESQEKIMGGNCPPPGITRALRRKASGTRERVFEEKKSL